MTGSVVQLYSASFHTILTSHLKLTGDLQLVLTTNTAVFGPAAMGLCWLLNIQKKKILLIPLLITLFILLFSDTQCVGAVLFLVFFLLSWLSLLTMVNKFTLADSGVGFLRLPLV